MNLRPKPITGIRNVQRRSLRNGVPRLKASLHRMLRGSNVHHARVMAWGDSVGQEYFADDAQVQMYRENGWGGRWYLPEASNGTWYLETLTGGTYNKSDFDVAPNGFSISLGSGSSWELQANTAKDNPLRTDEMLCDTAVICYARESGAGTFDVELSTPADGLDVFTTLSSGVDASNASTAIGTATVSLSRMPAERIRISHASGGTVRIIGVLMYDSTSSGIILIPYTQGGIDVEDVSTNAVPAAYDALMQALAPSLVFWSPKDDLVDLESHLASFLSTMRSASGWEHFDWACVLPTAEENQPFNRSESATTEYIRRVATDEGHAIYDSRRQIREFEQSFGTMEPAQSITSLTRSGETATATVTNHRFENDDVVSISGASDSNFDDDLVDIAVVDTNTFTYTVLDTGATSATGASVQWLAGTHQDRAHLSAAGRNGYAQDILEQAGLLGNQLARLGRDVACGTIEASDDVIVGGQSLEQIATYGQNLAWTSTRGFSTDLGGIRTSGGLTDVGTGDFTLSMHVLLRNSAHEISARVQNSGGTSTQPMIQVRVISNEIILTRRNNANDASLDRRFDYDMTSRLDNIVHIVVQRISGDMLVWVDGRQLKHAKALDSGPADFAEALASTHLHVFSSVANAPSDNFMMETAFWPSGLSENQIKEYARTRFAPGSPELLWRYDTNAGNRVIDASGNGNEGTAPYDVGSNDAPDYRWNAKEPNQMIFAENEDGTLRINEEFRYGRDNGATGDWALPTPNRVGDWVSLFGQGRGKCRITQSAGHQIFTANGDTNGIDRTTLGAAGILAFVGEFDCVKLRCVFTDPTVPDHRWVIESGSGNYVFT